MPASSLYVQADASCGFKRDAKDPLPHVQADARCSPAEIQARHQAYAATGIRRISDEGVEARGRQGRQDGQRIAVDQFVLHG